jgi:hypothetical protein
MRSHLNIPEIKAGEIASFYLEEVKGVNGMWKRYHVMDPYRMIEIFHVLLYNQSIQREKRSDLRKAIEDIRVREGI